MADHCLMQSAYTESTSLGSFGSTRPSTDVDQGQPDRQSVTKNFTTFFRMT
jgi:hypothetical protein